MPVHGAARSSRSYDFSPQKPAAAGAGLSLFRQISHKANEVKGWRLRLSHCYDKGGASGLSVLSEKNLIGRMAAKICKTYSNSYISWLKLVLFRHQWQQRIIIIIILYHYQATLNSFIYFLCLPDPHLGHRGLLQLIPAGKGTTATKRAASQGATFVSHGQCAVEVLLLHGPRAVVQFVGDPAWALAVRFNGCKTRGEQR